MKLFYRLSEITDPEERLEDACLWKAMHDQFGDRITCLPASIGREELAALVTDQDVLFGRPKVWERKPGINPAPAVLRYWNDPAFIELARRRVVPCTYEQARAEVAKIHAEGRDAFIKTTAHKEFVSKVPVGRSIMDVAEEMIFSWIDIDWPVLLVQEHVDMRYEHRFAVMNRTIVAHSPVNIPLTPLDADRVHGQVSETPRSAQLEHNLLLAQRLASFAAEAAVRLKEPHCILDVCMIGDRPAIIELNPMQPGHFGLYAMDVREIARGIDTLLLPTVRRRAEEPEVDFAL